MGITKEVLLIRAVENGVRLYLKMGCNRGLPRGHVHACMGGGGGSGTHRETRGADVMSAVAVLQMRCAFVSCSTQTNLFLSSPPGDSLSSHHHHHHHHTQVTTTLLHPFSTTNNSLPFPPLFHFLSHLTLIPFFTWPYCLPPWSPGLSSSSFLNSSMYFPTINYPGISVVTISP